MGDPHDTLGEDVADDSRDAAVAIDHRRSRGAVIYNQAVLAFIHFQERRAGEFPAISELNEPSSYEMKAAGRIGERHNLFFRHERLLTDREAPRGGNGALKFDYGQLFRLARRQALDACGDELAVISGIRP